MKSDNLLLKAFFLLIVWCCLPENVSAAPGELDLTFSQDGISVNDFTNFGMNTTISNGDDEAKAVKIQPDGKIIAAGVSDYGFLKVCSVSRFNTDGTRDVTFNDGGKVIIPLNSVFICTGVAIQNDGKIIAAGYTSNETRRSFALVRLNKNGSLDTTFDLDGKVVTSISGTNDYANAIAVQPNGKIVVAGRSENGGNYDFSLARYNSNGSLDTTFDYDGKVLTDFSNSEDSANAVVIQSDGKIIAAGYSNISNSDFALARYNTDGSLDTSFDTDGRVVTSILNEADAINAVAVQSDGKIVAAGYAFNESQSNDFALTRYNSDGSTDVNFGNNGKVITSIFTYLNNGADDKSTGISILENGNILAVGTSYYASGAFALACYHPNGTLDNSFGSGGKAIPNIWGYDDHLNAAAIQNDGRIIAVGKSRMQIDFDFSVARINPNGSLDPSFDLDGKTFAGLGAAFSNANASAIQADGKIITAGYAGLPENYAVGSSYFALTRHNENGSLDTSFDNDGKVITLICGKDFAKSVAIQKDGKIIAAGVSQCQGNYYFALVRYNPDGSLDTSFDGDGKLVTSFFVLNDGANSIAVQDDGKIVAAGYFVRQGNAHSAIVRFNPDGSFDSSFGSGGKVISSFSQPRITALAIQSNGKIVVSGTSDYKFAVERYNSDGTLDKSFDRDGKVTISISDVYNFAKALSLQNDGKIVVAGSSGDNSDRDLAVIRLNPDGSLDSGFSDDGIVTISGKSSYVEATAVAVQTDGKILAGGNTYYNPTNFIVVRFNADGSLDNSFQHKPDSFYGDGGIATLYILDGSSDFLNALVLDSSGRAVLAGNAGGNFVVARILGDAAPAPVYVSLQGKVLNAAGQGVRNARVILTGSNGETRYAYTKSFGNYRFDGVVAGITYRVSISSKRHTFDPSTLMVTPLDSVEDLDFISEN